MKNKICSAGEGQEELFFCIDEVPVPLSQQNYTSVTSWILEII